MITIAQTGANPAPASPAQVPNWPWSRPAGPDPGIASPAPRVTINETSGIVLIIEMPGVGGAAREHWRRHAEDTAQDHDAGQHRPGDHPRRLRRVGGRRWRGARLGAAG